MPLTRLARNVSTIVEPGSIPADLELGQLHVKDLLSLCSRLNLVTTGARAALIKRIEDAWSNTKKLLGTPPPNQDGGDQVKNRDWLEKQFQQLQRQVLELLDREPSQDGLLSASQLTQVQSIVQGSLNEAIEMPDLQPLKPQFAPSIALPLQLLPQRYQKENPLGMKHLRPQ